jgi:hypothetical protein
MDYEVAKPFNTTNRRLRPGADVTPDDVAPFDWDHLVERGFVVVKPLPAAAEPQPLLAPMPVET